MLSIKTELKWMDGITYRGKEWADRSCCWRMWTDKLWQVTDSLWQCSFCAKWKKNVGEVAGFYRWSALKMKQHFDPRYEPLDEWHVSLPLMPLQASQTSINLTASCSINHPPKVLVTVSYKVLTVSYKVMTVSYKVLIVSYEVLTVTTLIMSPTSQYSRLPS